MGTRDKGFPTFEHGAYSWEGELERFGAFASGTRKARGWRRVVGYVLALSILAPLPIGLFMFVLQMLSR